MSSNSSTLAPVGQPLTRGTLAGVRDGARIRFGGSGETVGKSQVVTVHRDGSMISLAERHGGEVARFGTSAKVWAGATGSTVVPGRTSPAPKPSPAPKATRTPKPKVNTKGTVTSPTGLSVEELSERAKKAAATRKARELDPSYVSPSQRPALPADHPHRIRAAKAAATRQAIKAGTYTRPVAPNAGDRSGAARQAWVTRRTAQQATAAVSTKGKTTKTTTAPKRQRKTA